MLPSTRLSQKFTISTNSVSAPAQVSARDFRNISLSLVVTDTGGSSALSVRVRGSLQDAPPDFTVASTATNEWSYVQLKNMATNAYEDGATGLAITLAGTYALELNTDILTWVAMEVFSRTNGQVVGQFIFKNNQ